MVVSKKFLSVISGTAWVTNSGNITKVLSDRVDALKSNEKVEYCPKT